MKTKSLDRWSELPLPNGKALRNRVVVPPMASQTADENGFVTEATLEHYRGLSEAQAGLVFVEYTFVDPSGRSEDNQLGIQTDLHVLGLSKLAKTIRNSGALAGIQITHGGGKTERSMTGGVLMAPSAVAVPVKDRQLETPDPMNEKEIELWLSAFARAADRAVEAGFDVLEFHSAHGYGLNQWLSPLTNQRGDSYGAGLEGRMLLLLKIIKVVRAKHPELLLSVRMPGQDFIEGGLRPEDTIRVARVLEAAGVSLIHVSSGIGGWRRPSARVGEGYLVSEAAQIQAAVQVPVIGVGGIESGAYIDESLLAKRFALAAVGRAILKNPKQWGETHLSCSADYQQRCV
jgi:NADPH2 dehydrogenase